MKKIITLLATMFTLSISADAQLDSSFLVNGGKSYAKEILSPAITTILL